MQINRLHQTPVATAAELRIPAQTHFQQSFHRHHHPLRNRLIDAFNQSFSPSHRRRAVKLASCARTARLTIAPESTAVGTWIPLCHDRLCPTCGRSRQAKLAAQIAVAIGSMKEPKHVTLTYRSNDHDLDAQVRQLTRAFRQLRRRPPWRGRVRGGVYTIEITYNTATGRWHPHIHALIDSPFIHWQPLAAAWSAVMPGGEHIWITEVTDPAKAANEISKYVSKPPNLTPWPDHIIRTYATAIAGHRMIQTFGNLHGRKLLPDRALPEPKPETWSITIPHIAALALQGFVAAQDVAVLLSTWQPAFTHYLVRRLPDLGNWTIDYEHARAPPPVRDLPDDLDPTEVELYHALLTLKTADTGYADYDTTV